MAEEKSAAAVTVDGREVRVNLAFAKSWNGVLAASRLQKAAKAAEGAKGPSGEVPGELVAELMAATVDYYAGAIENVDEITAEMGDEPFEKVMAVFSEAVSKATPKN